MPNILKYDASVRLEILRLAVDEGKSYQQIARLLGIHRNTLTRWLDRYKLRALIDELKAEDYKLAIEVGLKKLAEGAKTVEITKEYLDEEEGQPVKVTEKIREYVPDTKAIQVLAQKYEKIYSNGKDTDSKANASHLSININNSGMTLRELQSNKTESLPIVEANCVEVESEESDLVPPTKDSDD